MGRCDDADEDETPAPALTPASQTHTGSVGAKPAQYPDTSHLPFS